MSGGSALLAARLPEIPVVQAFAADHTNTSRIEWSTRVVWVILAAIPSALLLATIETTRVAGRMSLQSLNLTPQDSPGSGDQSR